jgi:putrescine transport system substrate-binding protein
LKGTALNRFFPLFAILLVSFTPPAIGKEEAVLNIYNWHEYMPQDVLETFTQETGIKVNYDIYESNEILETKLLSGSSGYDLVCPSAWPFMARQIPAGVYQKLQKEKIKNLRDLHPEIMAQLQALDPNNEHAVPYLWGVTGFTYQKNLISKKLPNAPTDSWAMFFDPNVIQHFSECGVTLLEEPAEVIIPAYLYLGLDPKKENVEDLKAVEKLLSKIRPYIRRFDASRSHDDIATGETCLAQHWLSSVAKSEYHLGPNKSPQLTYRIPKEGALIWIDCFIIPIDAPHPNNAHKFLEFILQPHIMAQISNFTRSANAVPASYSLMDKELTQNTSIFLKENDFKRLFKMVPFSPKFMKLLTRTMTRIRTGR